MTFLYEVAVNHFCSLGTLGVVALNPHAYRTITGRVGKNTRFRRNLFTRSSSFPCLIHVCSHGKGSTRTLFFICTRSLRMLTAVVRYSSSTRPKPIDKFSRSDPKTHGPAGFLSPVFFSLSSMATSGFRLWFAKACLLLCGSAWKNR